MGRKSARSTRSTATASNTDKSKAITPPPPPTEKKHGGMLNVRVYEPGKPGEDRTIPHDLKTMQKIVGGFIEAVAVAPGLMVVCNENGKPEDLPPSWFGFLGTIFVVRRDALGNFQSLTPGDMAIVKAWERDGRTFV